MNKLKAAVIILLVFSLGALAGSIGNKLYFKCKFERFAKAGPPPVMHILMKKMVHHLDLTEAQQAEIEKIVRQADEKILNFRQKYRPEFEKIIDDTITQIKGKLNEEQQKKLDKIHEKLKARGRMAHRGGPHGRWGGDMLDQLCATMKERLNLTKEQEEIIRPIIEVSLEKKRTLFKKHWEQERENMRSLQKKMRSLDKKTTKNLSEVLTEEQITEYKKIQEESCLGIYSPAPPEEEPAPPLVP